MRLGCRTGEIVGVSRRPARSPALRPSSMLAPDAFVFDTRIRDGGRCVSQWESRSEGARCHQWKHHLLTSPKIVSARAPEHKGVRETCTGRKNGGLMLSRRPSFRREVEIRNVETINFQSASTGPVPVRELNSPTWARTAAGARGRSRTRRRREHGRSYAWR